MFVAWLRGFLEGIGDNDLTPEQGQRIIDEVRRSLGMPLVENATLSPESTASVQTIVKGQKAAKGKPGKPVSRADVMKAASAAEILVPGMPPVERLG